MVNNYSWTIIFVTTSALFAAIWFSLFWASLGIIMLMILLSAYNKTSLWLIAPIILLASFHLGPVRAHKPTGEITAQVKRIYDNSMFVKHRGDTYYIMSGPTLEYSVGDMVSFDLWFNELDGNNSFTIFVQSGGAKFMAYANEGDITIETPSNSYRSQLYRSIMEQDSIYSDFMTALLYKTRTDRNSDILDSATNIGISHLFVVSGFHVSLFFIILDKISAKFIKNDTVRLVSNSTVTFTFLWFIFMPYSGVRALMVEVLSKTLKTSRYNALGITGLLFLLYNPWLLMSSGVILSFAVAYVVQIIIGWGFDAIGTTVFVSLGAFATSLPIVATWNTTFNVFAPLFTVILTPIISALYIFLIFTIPFYPVMFLFDFIFLLISLILNFLDSIKITFEIIEIEWSETILLLMITYTMFILNGKNREGWFSV